MDLRVNHPAHAQPQVAPEAAPQATHTTAGDPHIFVPQNEYRPAKDYFDCASALLPKMWRLMQGHFWTQAIAPKRTGPVQGWKIHVSATPSNAKRILEKVAPVCIGMAVEFKFTSDERILRQLLAKSCARQSSGKFITIYPSSEAIFRQLMEQLYPLLQDEVGPYILSDQRYKDSRVLHYRYGGFHSFPEMDAKGKTTMCILNDGYNFIEDIRAPRFALPSFVRDILAEPQETSVAVDSGDASTLAQPKKSAIFGDKYEISSVIKFSNAGGVYHGKNIANNEAVIIKESRPYTGIDLFGTDNITRLKKEFRILNKLAHEGIAPKAYDIFNEWEHFFLAQEVAKGCTLRQFMVASSPLIHNHASADSVRKWLEDIMKISIRLIDMVIRLHRNNIIFGDLSLNNVMIDTATLDLKLIDFEGAYEPGIDPPTNMFTPGYGRISRTHRDDIEWADDYYALGNMLLALLAPNPTVNQINEDFAMQFISAVREEIGLPPQFGECMLHLLNRKDADLPACIKLLEAGQISDSLTRKTENYTIEPDIDFCSQALRGIFDYNLSVMNLQHAERLFPVASKLSDPMAVDRGMIGIAYAWQKVKGEIPSQCMDWLKKRYRPTDARPGLMNGLSGTAWVMLELGQREIAASALRSASLHPLLFQNMSLGNGAAGYGLANLHFWNKTQEPRYLQEASKIADILCETAIEHSDGLAWEDPSEANGCALGWLEGGSGIALFLLYAYCATGEARYLRDGERGLQFELAHVRETGGSFGLSRRSAGPDRILYPYLEYGTAGLASVVLRYYTLTGKHSYRTFAENVKDSLAHKFAVVPGLFSGLAGLGNYLLDAHAFLHDASYLALAHRTAQGIKLFRIERDGGYTFPALDQGKLTCDYACGSAGIALFLHRLLEGGGNFNFMLDELIEAGKTSLHQHEALTNSTPTTQQPTVVLA